MPEAVAPPGTTALARRDLLASLDPLLREWLPRQRWFAGKGRPLTGFTLLSATDLLPPGADRGLLHLLVRVEQPSDSSELPAPYDTDVYQLLVGVHTALPERLAPALIGHADRGPLSGLALYEALHDPRLAQVLLEALRSRARIGALSFEHDADTSLEGELTPRVLGAEQSNSSLVYGDRYILKLIRRVVEGVNPDLELPLVLARDGCRQVPGPVGWFLTEGGARPGPTAPGSRSGADTVPQRAPEQGAFGGRGGGPAGSPQGAVLGVMTPFLHATDDGWELALETLAARSDFTGEARELGRATAQVHTSLARSLPTVPLRRPQLDVLARAMTERLESAAEVVPALREFAPALRTAYQALGELDTRQLRWSVQRVHGDLHLGQCLREPSGAWSIIDFEGEPARPLAERRLPQPPVRDVAGMLRSFDYAARSHDPWSPQWAEDCRDAYCAGYAEVAGHDPRADPVLLRAYETDKAVYEVVYESRNRPDWVSVPMAAVRRLAASGGRDRTAAPEVFPHPLP